MEQLTRSCSRLVAVMAIIAVAGDACLAQEKKFAGAQFTLTEPKSFVPKKARPTKTSQNLLPPLRVKILVPGKASISSGLKKYLPSGADWSVRPSPKQYILESAGRNAIGAVLAADEVRRVEIVRPPRAIDLLPPLPGPATRNLDSRLTHHVPAFVATYHNGNGKTITAAVFDGGAVRATHQEFLEGPDEHGNTKSRVTLRTDAGLADHATHVAGTIGAKGVRQEAEGMAPSVSILSYDWVDDLSNLEVVASEVQVTNHSYGPSTGWDYRPTIGWIWWGDTTISEEEDANFGKYVADNHVLDDLLHRNPNVLVVVAAGNDRSDPPLTQPVSHYVRGRNPDTGEPEWYRSSAERNPDGFNQGGLDTIAGLGLSKNVLCVGAINDMVRQGEPIPHAVAEPTSFTSWGPSDDRRVKPDVVANGDSLLSPSSLDDDAYREMWGTSMASPTAAGIACLLAEFFKKQKEDWPTSAELKAVLIHTANDDRQYKGPDPVFGWGWIDALRAGQVIAGKNGATIRSEEVDKGGSRQYQLKPSEGPIRVTLVWTDPPAPPNTGGLDDSTKTLQNDLDLTLVNPKGKTYHPYRLSPNPLDPAQTDGPNKVDNVEVIDAPNADGTWTIRVKAADFSEDEKQSFALVVTGLKE